MEVKRRVLLAKCVGNFFGALLLRWAFVDICRRVMLLCRCVRSAMGRFVSAAQAYAYDDSSVGHRGSQCGGVKKQRLSQVACSERQLANDSVRLFRVGPLPF